jgi:hypothetical protein
MDAETQPQAPPIIRMTLELDQVSQQIKVDGPLPNRGVCYMMLKLAEKAIDEFHAARNSPLITPGNRRGPLGGFKRDGFRG